MDLQRLGLELARGEGARPGKWPAVERYDYWGWVSSSDTDVVAHSADPGVFLGAAPTVSRCDYDAVVRLCRMGTADANVPAEDHAHFWLIDSALP